MPNPLYTDNYTLTDLGKQAAHEIEHAIRPIINKYKELGANLRELAGLIADEAHATAAEGILLYQIEHRKKAREKLREAAHHEQK